MGATLAEHIKLPWSLSSALCALVFMQLGVDHKNATHLQPWPKPSLWILLSISWLVSLWSPLNGGVGLAGPTVNNPGWFLLFAVAGIGISVALAQLIGHRLSILTWLGKNSLGLLVLHMLAIKGVKVLLSLGIGVSMHTLENDLLWGLGVLTIASVLSAIAVVLIQRWWPWALGGTVR